MRENETFLFVCSSMSTAADQLWFAVTRFVSPNNSSEDALVVTFILKEKKNVGVP